MKQINLDELNEKIKMYFKRQAKKGTQGVMSIEDDMDEFDRILVYTSIL